MALYPPAMKLLIPPGSNDPAEEMTAAILHVDAGNADSLYHLFLGPSGLESHFFVTKRPDPARPGFTVVEQYRDTRFQADAAFKANDFGVMIETQGYGSGEWPPDQLRTIMDLLLWIHDAHPKVLLRKCPDDNGHGVGYHAQFASWNLSHHSCPGPDRIRQFENVLVPWMASDPAKPKPKPVEVDMQLSDKIPGKSGDTVGDLFARLDQFLTGQRAYRQRVKAQLVKVRDAVKAGDKDLTSQLDELQAAVDAEDTAS